MSEPVRFVVPGRPIAKGRPRFAPNGHVYTPRRTRVYEDTVAWAARASGLKLKAGDKVRLRLEACYAKGPWPDADNVLKAACDGLQRGFPAWDDRDVVECSIIQGKAETEELRVLVEVLEPAQETLL